jgi:hypothetical protein
MRITHRSFPCSAAHQPNILLLLLLPPLLQMFGPYAALKLAELSEGVVLDCLSQLDECLGRWKELLDPVTMAVVVSGGCAAL